MNKNVTVTELVKDNLFPKSKYYDDTIHETNIEWAIDNQCHDIKKNGLMMIFGFFGIKHSIKMW